MTIRTVLSTLFIFALPLLMLGCDGGGSAMKQEPQQMEELKLSIYHPPESKAQTKSTIKRSASELQSGNLLNVFVNGPNEREDLGITYPDPGGTTVATFTVPAGDYDVDLLGYRDLDSPDRNSAIVFASTGTSRNVDVESGEVTEVDFSGGSAASQGGRLSYFDLSFDADLQFKGNSSGNQPRKLDVTLQGNNPSNLADRIFESGDDIGESLGGIGIDPNSGTIQGDRSNARDNEDFTSRSGATLTTDKFNLPPGQSRDGSASVLLELRIDGDYVGSDQDPVYLYNNVDGSAQPGVNIGGDGGIIVII